MYLENTKPFVRNAWVGIGELLVGVGFGLKGVGKIPCSDLEVLFP